MTAGSLNAMVDEYLDDCRARDLRPNTVDRIYATPLRSKFVPWAAEQGLSDPAQFTRPVVNRYASHLLAAVKADGTPLSKASVANYLRPVNQLLHYFQRERGLPDVAAKLPKSRPGLVDVLTEAEATMMVGAVKDPRDKLLLRLLWETGARIGEVAHLKLSGVIARNGVHFVVLAGKTGARETGISGPLYIAIQRYVRSGRPETSLDSLFISRIRRRGTGEYAPLEESGIYQVVKDAAVVCGLDKRKRVHPHLFRKGRITDLVQRGVDMSTVAHQLGVSPKVILEHYSHPSLEAQHKAMYARLEKR